MASPELQRLFKLHEIDEGLRTAKIRVKALDGGKAKIGELREIKATLDAAEAEAHKAGGEAKDAELEQAQNLTKADNAEKELYSGKITGAREVEDRTRYIESLRNQTANAEPRIAELQATSKAKHEAVEPLKAEFEAKRKEAQIEVKRQQLAAEKLAAFIRQKEPQRDELAKTIPAALLNRYEDTRTRHKGVGMARVTPENTCGACGNAVPTRSIEALQEVKVVTCEACHRILYWSEGVV